MCGVVRQQIDREGCADLPIAPPTCLAQTDSSSCSVEINRYKLDTIIGPEIVEDGFLIAAISETTVRLQVLCGNGNDFQAILSLPQLLAGAIRTEMRFYLKKGESSHSLVLCIFRPPQLVTLHLIDLSEVVYRLSNSNTSIIPMSEVPLKSRHLTDLRNLRGLAAQGERGVVAINDSYGKVVILDIENDQDDEEDDEIEVEEDS